MKEIKFGDKRKINGKYWIFLGKWRENYRFVKFDARHTWCDFKRKDFR